MFCGLVRCQIWHVMPDCLSLAVNRNDSPNPVKLNVMAAINASLSGIVISFNIFEKIHIFHSEACVLRAPPSTVLACVSRDIMM